MIQVRNVPGPIHRKLKARAAMAGMSLSDYLLAELKRIAERPTVEEMADRLRQRRYRGAGETDPYRGQEMIADLADLPIIRHSHSLLLPRIRELRTNLSAYDAAYVAVAEALNAPLLTRDARLASVRGRDAAIELL